MFFRDIETVGDFEIHYMGGFSIDLKPFDDDGKVARAYEGYYVSHKDWGSSHYLNQHGEKQYGATWFLTLEGARNAIKKANEWKVRPFREHGFNRAVIARADGKFLTSRGSVIDSPFTFNSVESAQGYLDAIDFEDGWYVTKELDWYIIKNRLRFGYLNKYGQESQGTTYGWDTREEAQTFLDKFRNGEETMVQHEVKVAQQHDEVLDLEDCEAGQYVLIRSGVLAGKVGRVGYTPKAGRFVVVLSSDQTLVGAHGYTYTPLDKGTKVEITVG